ncbi:MAG: cell division protein ZapA [Prevotellaceae bacterium]|jgi:cell division protein ZapA|nr:cell division protein ZapA [Prevotellaceae bacterium]
MDEKLSIRVNIAERYYPLKVDRNDEEKMRRAVKFINEKVLSFKQRHGDKDVQDWLSMACMFFALKVVESEADQDLELAVRGMRDLDKKLSEYLDYVVER